MKGLFRMTMTKIGNKWSVTEYERKKNEACVTECHVFFYQSEREIMV
jgi:hypothetical protein